MLDWFGGGVKVGETLVVLMVVCLSCLGRREVVNERRKWTRKGATLRTAAAALIEVNALVNKRLT